MDAFALRFSRFFIKYRGVQPRDHRRADSLLPVPGAAATDLQSVHRPAAAQSPVHPGVREVQPAVRQRERRGGRDRRQEGHDLQRGLPREGLRVHRPDRQGRGRRPRPDHVDHGHHACATRRSTARASCARGRSSASRRSRCSKRSSSRAARCAARERGGARRRGRAEDARGAAQLHRQAQGRARRGAEPTSAIRRSSAWRTARRPSDCGSCARRTPSSSFSRCASRSCPRATGSRARSSPAPTGTLIPKGIIASLPDRDPPEQAGVRPAGLDATTGGADRGRLPRGPARLLEDLRRDLRR